MTMESSLGQNGIGREIHDLIVELFPICRSITGDGFRRTMGILRRLIPIEIREVPSGTQVFDWTVPKEWNIRDAFIIGPDGNKIVDFRTSNLHVLNYSSPVRKTVGLAELKQHLYTLPEYPDWIPYRTSYYREAWGFCMSHRQYRGLQEGTYEVLVDSTLEDGSLTYAELLLKGEQEDEILISTHACHPSLANDNLSGVCLAALLARHLGSVPKRYSYRFLFIPGTIGAITWLSLNESRVGKIKGGLVIAGVGDQGALTYKKSRRGASSMDRAACCVIGDPQRKGAIVEFDPYGYDERQYCSPGFDLPVGRLSRTPFGEYPEYHTSADNLDFVRPDSLEDSFRAVLAILEVLEHDGFYMNLNPKGEPQLGKRGLYQSPNDNELALLWTLNLSDGGHSLVDIAERSGMDFGAIWRSAAVLVKAGLLKEI